MDTFLFNYPRYKHNISSQNIPMFVLYLTTRRILQQRLQWLECEVLCSRSIIYIGCYLQNSRCGLQISVLRVQSDCSYNHNQTCLHRLWCLFFSVWEGGSDKNLGQIRFDLCIILSASNHISATKVWWLNCEIRAEVIVFNAYLVTLLNFCQLKLE